MLNCRSCHSAELKSIIPLGVMPLANALLKSPDLQNELKCNLEVMLCSNCGLAQLKDQIDPALLFSDYVYFSSNSVTMLKSAANLVEKIIPGLGADPLIIEVASNDGYLLKNYVMNNIPVLGIDPAQNIAKIANENGVTTLCDFFGEDLANKLAKQGKLADVIHANNVMAHVPDINGFIKGLKIVLKSSGQAIIEVPYFLDLVLKKEFDTIYHEHVFYFSLMPLKNAFERNGLEIFDIEKLSIHGGTIRLYVSHTGYRQVSKSIVEMIEQEHAHKLYDFSTYSDFMYKLNALKENLKSVLSKLKERGGKIAAYGASAKGTTLLNFFGIDKKFLDFVVDRSTVKQNLYTPGTKLEIKNPAALISEGIMYALLLTWNFAEEIIDQQHEFISKGGKFIIPLPEIKQVP